MMSVAKRNGLSKRIFKVTQFQYPANVKDAGAMSQRQFNIAFKKTKAKLKGGN